MTNAVAVEDEEVAYISHVRGASVNKNPPIMVTVSVNGKPLDMELDTGSSVSTMPHSIYCKLCPDIPLDRTPIVLKPYGTLIRIVPRGVLTTAVRY